MSKFDFKTDRLTITDWRKDVDDPDCRRALESALADILTKDVLAPLPPPLQFAEGGRNISAWITARAAESDVSCITVSQTSKLIGLLLLATESDAQSPPVIRIGYLLARPDWGKGFATELIAGLVAHFALGAPVLLMGGVAHGNPASAQVLEKVGFARDEANSGSYTDMFVRKVGQSA